MGVEPSVVDRILIKHCYGAPKEDREACAKALKEVFKDYETKTSNRISDLEIQVDEYEESLVEAREAKEEMEAEVEDWEQSEAWDKMVNQFWHYCERT